MHMAPVDAAATVATTTTAAPVRDVKATTLSDSALLQAASGMATDGSDVLIAAAEVEETPLDAPVKGVAGALKNFEGLAVLAGLPVAFLSSQAFQKKQREVEEQVRCREGVGRAVCIYGMASPVD